MAAATPPKKESLAHDEETAPSKTEEHYFTVPVPHLSSFTSPKGLLLLVLLSYLLSGLLYLKIRSLESGGSSGGGNQTVVGTNATSVNDALVDYAKSLKLDTKKFASCLSSHKYTANITTDINEGTTAGINATPGFIVDGNVIVGAQPFATFKTIIDQELSRSVRERSFAFLPKAYAQTDTAPLTTQKVTVNDGHLPVLGKKDAKVTIVEFSDFQCPFCKQFFSETLPQLKKEYIDTGKVKLFYRQFPLTSIHPNAQIAAEAAECANEQGKFWEYHDILFTNQASWVNLPQSTSQAT